MPNQVKPEGTSAVTTATKQSQPQAGVTPAPGAGIKPGATGRVEPKDGARSSEAANSQELAAPVQVAAEQKSS